MVPPCADTTSFMEFCSYMPHPFVPAWRFASPSPLVFPSVSVFLLAGLLTLAA
jgi:hypothetical protein